MKIGLIFITCLSLYSCAMRSYSYKTQMTHPASSEHLRFENDTFSIDFDLMPKWIGFTIYNKSNDGIRIDWNEASFSLNGQTFRALHKQTGLANINEVQPVTTIPPKSNLDDYLIPRDKMLFVKNIYGSEIPLMKDIFPMSDYGSKKQKEYIQRLKGVRLTVFLPFYIRGQYVSNYYDIIIKDITSKK